jgi:transposase
MVTRRKFSREFKVEAVKLVTERGLAVVQVARDLEVGETVLRRWMRELAQDPQQAFPGKGVMRGNETRASGD